MEKPELVFWCKCFVQFLWSLKVFSIWKFWAFFSKFSKFSKQINYRKISMDRAGGIHFFSTHNFWTSCHRTTIKAYSEKNVHSLRICFYRCSPMYDSKVMCRKEVDTPWSIYRDFTVYVFIKLYSIRYIIKWSFRKMNSAYI